MRQAGALDAETKVVTEIEITPEMIGRAAEELAGFSLDYMLLNESAENIIRAALAFKEAPSQFPSRRT